MNISEWLSSVTSRLEKAGIGTAHLDALILLEDELGKDRSWLLAHPELVVQGTSLYKLNEHVDRRVRHEPLAYIRGKTEFYGREFYVNKYVLEPRPESETMIELLQELENKEQRTQDSKTCIVDVGTGSGALAITAKLEFPEAEVVAVDIDPSCLKVARKNAKNLGADVTFLHGDLLEPMFSVDYLFIVLANLPYVPDDFTINRAAMNEPRHAIFGGPDGLDLYRSLFAQTRQLEQPPECILTESLPLQHQSLSIIAKSSNYKLQKTEDFIQTFIWERRPRKVHPDLYNLQ